MVVPRQLIRSGKFVRYCGTFVEGATYCGSADETGDYIDIVYHEAKKAYLQCVIGGTYTSSKITTNQDNPSSYNWLVSSFEFVATKVLFAETAYVRNLALVNMLAGYYNSSGQWIPMIEIDGNGNLLINRKGQNGLILNDNVLKMKHDTYSTSVNHVGIGHTNGDAGFSIVDALFSIYNKELFLELTPEGLQYPNKNLKTTWEKVIGAANGIRIEVVSAIPSVTEANVLYVVI